VSLLRAAGVPAELREGMALDGSELVAHAWVAFHDGTGWREIDPTFGVTFVDAGHLETSVLDFISLVSVGRLKIVRVDAAKP
jgi:transglutaminase-like putative cysteine protease